MCSYARTQVSLVRSKRRAADRSEVFMPEWLVEGMIDLAKDKADEAYHAAADVLHCEAG